MIVTAAKSQHENKLVNMIDRLKRHLMIKRMSCTVNAADIGVAGIESVGPPNYITPRP